MYIWGDGNAAGLTDRELRAHGIVPVGHVVDDEYADGQRAIARTQLLQLKKPYIIVRGFKKSFFLTKREVLDYWPGFREEFAFFEMFTSMSVVEPITEAYYKSHLERFEHVRNHLADELSKQTFDAFIGAKTTGLFSEDYLGLIEKKQYFGFPAPWHFTDSEVFVDCGAYNGDSVAAFVDTCGRKYQKIVAVEPEPENFRQLLQNIEKNGLPNVKAYCLGIYDRKGEISFSGGSSSISAVSADGNSSVKVDTIDNILQGGSASIIKMDIEGSERFALRGARKTIQNYRPLLMICVYHKRDDIYTLFDQISAYVSEYSFYLRWHLPAASELVLYAVPEERLLG